MSSEQAAVGMFLRRYVEGKVSAEDIDDFVEAWHQAPGGKSLPEFFGMTEAEYSQWLRDPDVLPQIAAARRAQSCLFPAGALIDGEVTCADDGRHRGRLGAVE